MQFKEKSPFPEGSTYKWAGVEMDWEGIKAKALTYAPEGLVVMPTGLLEVIKPNE